ncbi:J domain-containing protein [Nannocystis pusilla]|uniref:J domain-containing protein n=1 Tax=Nannocystis pusilla TaxID=889268 RepID=A0ABS7U4C7_9BACT|nr:J domain-containing protein [Nannocystis pusilla]MBZ5715269.1 J domain-containing protein [Nannocystis pusilla]
MNLYVTRREALSIFQVPPDVDADAVKSKFRELSKDLHPDKHPGNQTVADLYSRVSSAYSILTGDMQPDPEPAAESAAKKETPKWIVRGAEVAGNKENKKLLQELLGSDDAADLVGIFARSFLGTLRGGGK